MPALNAPPAPLSFIRLRIEDATLAAEEALVADAAADELPELARREVAAAMRHLARAAVLAEAVAEGMLTEPASS